MKKNLYSAPLTEQHTMLLVSNLLAGSSAPSSDIGITDNPAEPLYPEGGD